MLGWRTAFQKFDVCNFVALTITILGFVAMLSAYSPVELAASSWLAIAVQLVAHRNFAVRPRLEAVLCCDDGTTQLLRPRLKQVVRAKKCRRIMSRLSTVLRYCADERGHVPIWIRPNA